MNYVYILRSQVDKELYIGCTNDLPRRFEEHNTGKIYSTNDRTPLELIYYEAFISKQDAFAREQWLKTGWGRNHMQKMLSSTFRSFGGHTIEPPNFSTINKLNIDRTEHGTKTVKSLGG